MRPEEALVRACAGGDSAAWRRFVELYSGWVLRIALASFRRRTGAPVEADAEDVCAEVFRQLLERDHAMLRSLRPPYNLRAWLAIVTRRACGKLLRKRAPLPSAGEPAQQSPESGDLLDLLAKLPPQDRLILQLYFVHDSSYDEIGAVLGMSPESVGKAKFRAIEKLRSLAKASGVEGLS